MTHFIDTAVIMLAAGADHPLQPACASVLRAHAARQIDAVTSAEVVQEILHRFSTGDRSVGDAMAAATLQAFRPVLPIDDQVVDRARRLMNDRPTLLARDAVHVATCQVNGIGVIVTPDRDFDGIEGLTRLDPAEFA